MQGPAASSAMDVDEGGDKEEGLGPRSEDDDKETFDAPKCSRATASAADPKEVLSHRRIRGYLSSEVIRLQVMSRFRGQMPNQGPPIVKHHVQLLQLRRLPAVHLAPTRIPGFRTDARRTRCSLWWTT